MRFGHGGVAGASSYLNSCCSAFRWTTHSLIVFGVQLGARAQAHSDSCWRFTNGGWKSTARAARLRATPERRHELGGADAGLVEALDDGLVGVGGCVVAARRSDRARPARLR